MLFPGGQRDTVHTNVGLVRFTLPEGRFRCSGTLIAPTVVLTAGHCTEGPATNVYVSFDTDLQPDPLQPGISPAERAAREAHYITASPSRSRLGRQIQSRQAARPGRGRPRRSGVDEVARHHPSPAAPRSATWTATRASSRSSSRSTPTTPRRVAGRASATLGAVFLNGYVLGDASYVNSLTCNTTGSYQRDDTPYSRAFLNQFLNP